MNNLITIEGGDGCGKNTQAKILVDSLNSNGFKAKLYSFPGYDSTFFGKEIGAYLRGEFGSLYEVNHKLASILYACDRFEHKNALLNDLNFGTIVVCDRYVDSNLYQCAKLNNIKDQDEYINWLSTMEYEVFGTPKPGFTLYLDVPTEISAELVLKKKSRSYTDDKEDIHESSYEFLDNVRNVYKRILATRNSVVIDCVDDNNNLRSIYDISSDIYNSCIEFIN